MIFLLLVQAFADEMWYNDIDNGFYYEWSSLQSKVSYVYYTDEFSLTFNFATNADEKCAKGAVVAKFVDGNCVVMGKEDDVFAKPFEYTDKTNGIIITYIGEKCINSYASNYKTHFKIICDEKASEFRVTDVSSCEVHLEKRDPAGCKYETDQSLVLFSILFGVTLIILSIVLALVDAYIDDTEEAPAGPIWREMKTIVRKGKKVIFRRNDNKYENV